MLLLSALSALHAAPAASRGRVPLSPDAVQPALPGANTPVEAKTIRPELGEVLSSSFRFQLVMNDQAVLDKETALVWERSPVADARDFFTAMCISYGRIAGGRGGWRLPTIEELMSLVGPGNKLPAGHPFLNVKSYNYKNLPPAVGGLLAAQDSASYWSATTYGANMAWCVSFDRAGVTARDQGSQCYVWCVRSVQRAVGQ
jgi:hypothetical protein